ncbi:MAG: hypothetical protein ACRDWS_07300 [Acidimicrobiia bacterium]
MSWCRRIPLVTMLVLGTCGAGMDAASIGNGPPPSDRVVAIDTIELSSDGRVVTLGFVGSAAYVEEDPCTASYVGRARVIEGVLEAAVVVDIAMMAHGDVTPDLACETIGYGRHTAVELPQAYTGIVVRDLAGFTRFLARPDGSIEIGRLPPEWELRSESDLPESPTGRWMRTYSPVPIPRRDDPRLELIQSFDAPAGVSGGEEQSPIAVGNVEGLLYRDPPSGDLVLVWRPGSDGLAIAVNERDFTIAELVDLAAGIEPRFSSRWGNVAAT